MVFASQNLIELVHGLFVLLGINHFDHQVVDPSLGDAGALRRRVIARHGGIRHEKLRIIGAATVAAILFFLLQHADDRVRRAIHGKCLADGWLAGKQLVARFHAEHHHAPAFFFVVIAHQAALLHLERAEALVVGPHPAHRTRGRIVTADLGNVAPQFGTHRLDQVGLRLDDVGILNRQPHRTSRGISPGLFAGAPAPDNRQIDADRLEVFLLIAAESLAQPD